MREIQRCGPPRDSGRHKSSLERGDDGLHQDSLETRDCPCDVRSLQVDCSWGHCALNLNESRVNDWKQPETLTAFLMQAYEHSFDVFRRQCLSRFDSVGSTHCTAPGVPAASFARWGVASGMPELWLGL